MSVNFSSLSTLTVSDNCHKIEAYNEKYFSAPKEQKKLLFIEQLKLILLHRKPKKNHDTKRLNHYGELQNKNIIGTGASATVVFIKSKKNAKTYAVKIFNNKKKKYPLNMKKLISEFCISSALNHPNIVKTIDLVLDERKRYCTVMEYCSGGDLYSFIKEGRLTLHDEINGYFKQLLDGLSYLHSLGVAHRDIKPENLLLVKQANTMVLKITDFGEADVFREAWQSTNRLSDGLCGSTPYIAPEVFTHSRLGYNASQADVWSAGIVYFCMLLNGVPFFSAQSSDTNYRLYKSKYDTRDYNAFSPLDTDSRLVLYNMLNPDPCSRFTIQEILELPWLAEVKSPSYNTTKYTL